MPEVLPLRQHAEVARVLSEDDVGGTLLTLGREARDHLRGSFRTGPTP